MSIRTQRDVVFAQARIGYSKGEGSMRVDPGRDVGFCARLGLR